MKNDLFQYLIITCQTIYAEWCKMQVAVQPKLKGLRITLSFDDNKTDTIEIGEVDEQA